MIQYVQLSRLQNATTLVIRSVSGLERETNYPVIYSRAMTFQDIKTRKENFYLTGTRRMSI